MFNLYSFILVLRCNLNSSRNIFGFTFFTQPAKSILNEPIKIKKFDQFN